MEKITPLELKSTKEKQGQNGNFTIYTYKIKYQDMVVMAEAYKELPLNEEVDVLEVKDTEYGYRISLPKSGGGGGRFNDPEKDKRISRQWSINASLEYHSSKATALSEAVKHGLIDDQLLKDHVANYTGKHILQVALYFAGFVNGTISVDATAEDVAKIINDLGAKTPEPKKEPEVDPDLKASTTDLPF